jgi:glycosyltransferase involved in cell wall biosynthesis
VRVALVNQPFDKVLPPDQNSIGIWSYEVANRIADRCEVTVFGKATARPARHGGQTGAVKVGEARYRFLRVLPNRAWTVLGKLERGPGSRSPFYSSVAYHADFAARVTAALRRSRFDVIHIHNFTGFVPTVRAANPSAKLVLHMNCEWLSQLEYQRMNDRIGKVDMVFGSSDHITGLVRDRFPHHAHKCHTVYNGVDVDGFASRAAAASGDESRARGDADDASVLVFVGRLSPEKGLHDLIDAFGIVAERHPSARLELIGPPGVVPKEYIVEVSDDPLVAQLARFYDDDYLVHLENRVPPHVRERVAFTGPLSRADVADRVRRAAVLVNPSYSESFGMALVEAMASEVPVVATRAGGMKEIVDDGVTGHLVERGDVDGLAIAIDKVLGDRALRDSMGRAGRQRVLTRFAWEAVSEAALSRYRELVPR